jgi:hypothetical protein
MLKSRFGIASVLAGLAAAVAIAVAPGALATTTDANSGDNTGGALALPPGGPVAVWPQNQPTGGADPYLPFGTDPYVPFGVWSP